MSKYRIPVLTAAFLYLLFTPGFLQAEYWIKQLPAGDNHIYYEATPGTFLSLHPEFTIFDIKGNILKEGIFRRGNTEWIEIQETIQLDDGTFFGLAYSRSDAGEIKGLYMITRFTREGTVRYVKALRLNTGLFKFLHLFQVDNRIKLLGYDDPGTGLGNIVILTFSPAGEVLDARRVNIKTLEGRFFSSESAVIQTGDTSFMIVKTGDVRVNGVLQKGLFLIGLNTSHGLETIKSIYHPTSTADYFEAPVLTADPAGGYSLLMLEHKSETDGTITRTPYLLKFDSNWLLQWSKTIEPVTPVPWLKNTHLLSSENGYMIGLSKAVKVTDDNLSKPVLIKTNLTPQVSWSKIYDYGGPQGIHSILPLNNGGLLMSADDTYFYLLDDLGEVPEQCTSLSFGSPIQDIPIHFNSSQFLEQEVTAENCFQTVFPANISEYYGFLSEYNIKDLPAEEIFCLHLTLVGTFDTVVERSRFSGYLIHRLEFSVDPGLAPYISKFQVYRKHFESPDVYELVEEVTAVPNQVTYHLEYSPFVLGKSAYDYKVVALNGAGEIVDFVFLSE